MQAAARDAVITGLGAVCALAEDVAGLWAAVETGRDGISPIRRFPVDGFRVSTGAMVGSLATAGSLTADQLCLRFAERAAAEAVAGARLPAARIGPDRVALVFGTGLGDLERPAHELAGALAAVLGARGPCITVSNACSSSTCAIGIARDLLSTGSADAVIAGGADVLTPEVFAGFHALGVLSPDRCAPFSLPTGTTLGEGAGFVVIERRAAALARGATIRAALAGYGLSGDAFHETSPDPSGAGVERAIRGALMDAALAPGSVGYVNAHGSGTEANDPAEWRGIRRALEPDPGGVPVSSTKGALGHAQGAAGVLETIVTILAMERGVVPPTLHFERARPHVPPDPVPGPYPRPWTYGHALCINAAFGGANAALLLSRRAGPRAPVPRPPVHVTGVGLVSPAGPGTDTPADWNGSDTVPPFAIERLIPAGDLRGLDPASRYLSAAVALALRDAGVTLRGPECDAAGLFVATVHPSPDSMHAFRRSIDERGLHGLSAVAFARVVLNAPAGFCSKLLALRGPLSTFTTGPAGGLVAIVLAAETLSTRAGLRWMAAGGLEERVGPEGWEGAAMLLLDRVAPPDDGTRPVTVAGWGLAGPGGIEQAVARARAGLATSAAADERVFHEQDWITGDPRQADAAPSARACAAAVGALRRGDTRRALVVSRRQGAIAAALVLTA